MTDRGKAENERQLAAELAASGSAERIERIHHDFLPLNARLLRACTNWQLRPTPSDPLAANDHTDAAWDAAVITELAAIADALAPLASGLEKTLRRFQGYAARFTKAQQRAQAGEGEWVDRTDIDSCHRVWFELHEDLIATLSLKRG